jgi:hypothetical protein
MQINGPNARPTPAAEAIVPENKAHSAPVAAPKDTLDRQYFDPKTTNVVVEIEKNNTLVYKFIDEVTGKVIQEFPPEQMIQQNQTPIDALPPVKQGGTK